MQTHRVVDRSWYRSRADELPYVGFIINGQRTHTMTTITTFLTFNDQAAEAAAFYTAIFERSRIVSTMPGAGGTVMGVTFELDGQTFIALNGGPSFTFSQGISLFVSCTTQTEVDHFWTRLSDGGEESRCGWLKDRFGVSWQVVPTVLAKLLGSADREKSSRAMRAMLGMRKLDIAALQNAFDGT
jgi:predicted 3-demethylubiquinone-9 3-methyltransferase (glyoxalase superfamily)